MKIELVNEAGCPKCAEVRNFHAEKAAKLKHSGGRGATDGLSSASDRLAKKHIDAQKTDKCVDCRKADKNVNENACASCKTLRAGYEKSALQKRDDARTGDAADKAATQEEAQRLISLSSKAKCKECTSSVNESASKKEKHLRKSKEYAAQARTASNPEAKKRLHDMSKVEAVLAKQIDENFWNPRNVVSSNQTLGASTDNTVYQSQLKAERPYTPGKMDAMDTESAQKVSVPPAIIAQLDARAREAKAYSERLNVTKTDDKQFYLDLAQMFDDLNAYLRSGSVYDIKMASVFLTSLMGPMLYEIPTEAVRFITYGGSHAPLKSFMNSVTVPQGGIDMYSDVHKSSSKDNK